jgi:hypothetical protein
MRYSRQLVQEVTGEAPPVHSVVGWAGTQRKNDTLLWGQTANVSSPILDAAAPETFDFGSQQVIKVFYERPTTWSLKVFLTTVRPVAETASFMIFWTIQIGVGQTRMTLQRSHAFTTPALGFESFEAPLEQFPAQAVQVDMQAVVGQTGVILVGAHSASLTALIAPVFT